MKIYLYIICISYDCTRLCLASISQSSSFVSRLFLMFVSGRANSRFFFFFSVSGLKSLCYGIKSVRPALSRVHAFVQGASGPFAFYFFIYTAPGIHSGQRNVVFLQNNGTGTVSHEYCRGRSYICFCLNTIYTVHGTATTV